MSVYKKRDYQAIVGDEIKNNGVYRGSDTFSIIDHNRFVFSGSVYAARSTTDFWLFTIDI
ncbi:MAG: hypothetical protein LBJ36_03815 [Synergistaceae bacterium]|jgi:hypothetical protein|nr:hypothetical protein [Synergistaceae bacterium]